ncbi:alpha/beta hydrolase [Flavobacteriaceae bacterium S0825]|uniref:alpha/beta fold hydrolase n=1 Tax=Gaetbulibacter sp. S0825 TaxID=2720084 RepID=UPI0014313D41|nr:alpha/beta fold hydrolase [Gaetbulibacter sp. S0825]MCK0107865.1 alpha/beta hydrolase [Flavobacteriaceae bacterium S0825]NIX63501.1 alpha/beta hydrolase [Gaetbulibacter sp. S0825]
MTKYLQYVFPGLVARKIYNHMSHPKGRKLIKHEELMLNYADKEFFEYKGFSLVRYEWEKENSKTAFLVHGWEGQTGNFASLIPVLLKADYRVISIDAPSHGKSSIGTTTMFEFANILKHHFNQEKPDLIISHSFGSVNVARVLRLCPDINLKLWLMVTTPNNFKSRIDEIATKFNLNHSVTGKLISKIEEDVSESIENLNMVTYCSELSNVKKVVIVHSKSDKVLPIEGAREVNQSFMQSEIIELENKGHYSILWSDELKFILEGLLSIK